MLLLVKKGSEHMLRTFFLLLLLGSYSQTLTPNDLLPFKAIAHCSRNIDTVLTTFKQVKFID